MVRIHRYQHLSGTPFKQTSELVGATTASSAELRVMLLRRSLADLRPVRGSRALLVSQGTRYYSFDMLHTKTIS